MREMINGKQTTCKKQLLVPIKDQQELIRLHKSYHSYSKLHVLRILTSWLRVLPGFIIVGAQRCGSTSLFFSLAEHPDVYPPCRKEIDYFNNNFRRSLYWYRSHFPTSLRRYHATKVNRRPFLSGEASIDYMYHPHASKRLSDVIPEVKLIVLMRNPTDRAYSSYRHAVSLGAEHLPFEEALKREADRLDAENGQREQDQYYFCVNHWFFSYLARGIYVDQVKRLMTHFPRRQMLFVKSEDFFQGPVSVLTSIFSFLGLGTYTPRCTRRHRSNPNVVMNPVVRSRLHEYFEPFNRQLYDLVGRDFGWEKRSS